MRTGQGVRVGLAAQDEAGQNLTSGISDRLLESGLANARYIQFFAKSTLHSHISAMPAEHTLHGAAITRNRDGSRHERVAGLRACSSSKTMRSKCLINAVKSEIRGEEVLR
jgi:hypothetical protein